MKKFKTRALGSGSIFILLALSIGFAHEVSYGTEKIIGLVEIPKLIDTSYPDGPPESKMSDFATSSAFEPLHVYEKASVNSAVVTDLKRQSQIVTREYDYERNAGVVYEKKDGWYKIGLTSSGLTVGPQPSSGWLEAKSTARYYDLVALLKKAPYMTSNWNNVVYKKPDLNSEHHVYSSAFSENGLNTKADAVVLNHQWINDELWVEVQILGNGRCMGLKPNVVDRGWVKAYASSGEANVWYNPRGCPGHQL